MTTFAEAITEDDELLTTEEEDIGQGEIQFIPTGSKHRDMSIAGMINDAKEACKDLIRAKVWDAVCASPNPAGAAELAILELYQVPSKKKFKVLIKLKSLLAGRDMTVMQAQHKNILGDVLNRINVDKIEVQDVQTAVPDSGVESTAVVASAEPVTAEVVEVKAVALTGKILSNADGTTYEFGKRGRRPLWVQDWLKTNTEPT